jgi:hypothetical protein
VPRRRHPGTFSVSSSHCALTVSPTASSSSLVKQVTLRRTAAFPGDLAASWGACLVEPPAIGALRKHARGRLVRLSGRGPYDHVRQARLPHGVFAAQPPVQQPAPLFIGCSGRVT